MGLVGVWTGFLDGVDFVHDRGIVMRPPRICGVHYKSTTSTVACNIACSPCVSAQSQKIKCTLHSLVILIKPSGKCILQGQMISNHVEYFTWFDMVIQMRVSFYKNQIT